MTAGSCMTCMRAGELWYVYSFLIAPLFHDVASWYVSSIAIHIPVYLHSSLHFENGQVFSTASIHNVVFMNMLF